MFRIDMQAHDQHPRTFTNRLTIAQDGWVQLAPYGDWLHAGNDDRVYQRIDAATVAAMVNDWDQAGRQPLLVDYDHSSEDDDKTTEAAGWITDVQARTDGFYGKIEWTDAGKAAVDGKRYRFISPVWLAEKTKEQVNDTPVVVPFALLRAGLTNRPNLPVKPLTNRQTNPQNKLMENDLNLIRSRLGLSESASIEQILAALPQPQDKGELQNRVKAMEAQITQLTQERDTLRNSQIETDLERFKDVIGDDNKESATALLKANRVAAIKTFEGWQAKAQPGTQPLSNSRPPKDPNNAPDGSNNADAIEIAVRDYRNSRPNCSYRDAYTHIRATKPELFKS